MTLRAAAIASLAEFEQESIATRLLEAYAKFPTGVKSAAMDLLTSRTGWSRLLVAAVDSEKLDRSEVSLAHVEKLRQLDPALVASWPQTGVTSAEEIDRLKKIITVEGGVPKKGEALFTQRCAACHMMFNKGGAVGPDLTSYQKNDLDTLLLSVIDPSAEIREGFEQAIVKLKDGAVHSGFLVERDEHLLALRELSGTQRSIPRAKVAELKVIGASLMPPGLLGGLEAAQIRDLFAYLRSTTPPF